MQADFWQLRWEQGQIGFHEGAPNRFLLRQIDGLGAAGSSVFVPLCGKTADLDALASRGYRVTGCELVDRAVRDFFRERSVEPEVHEIPGGTAFDGAGVRLVRGDVFDFVCDQSFDAAFDRAALIAMPPEKRPAYAEKVLSLLRPGGRMLLVTMEHDIGQGPPFSVSEEEVRSLYEGACEVALIEREDAPDSQRFTSRGATFAREAAYMLEKR